MVSVRTSIFGRPRRLPGERRAADRYTLICEEPNWCGPCDKEAPHLVESYQETKGDEVEFVGINFREHSVETGLAQSETWGYKWPSVYDESGSTALDMQGRMSITPSTAVLDRDGRIAVVILGATTKKTVVEAIEDTVAEQDG